MTELDDICSVISHLDYHLKFKSSVATRENFRSIITDNPVVLHFSGHGIENTAENMGDDYMFNQEKGNILLLENESAMSNYYFEEELRSLLEICKYKFEVVFVSTCHSQFAGQVFLNAGAQHVICIKQEWKIMDKASLLFSKVFYETFFSKKFSACNSFKTAKKEVSEILGKTEASKFMLMTQDDLNPYSGKVHKCKGFANFSKGSFCNMNEEPQFDYVPSNIEGFIDRQREMYEIIKLLNDNRVVSILGPPGIGKTSLARNLSNYIKDRKKFKDGIIYVRLRGCESAQMFLSRLSLIILATLDETDPEVNPENKSSEDENESEDVVLKNLKDKNVLLVLDNAEDPLVNDQIKFSSYIETIIDFCPKVRILLTSRKPLDMLSHNYEKVYRLDPMPKESAIRLLISKSPRKISNDEIKELINSEIPAWSKLKKQMFVNFNASFGKNPSLLEHPFTLMLGGHPQAISLAAPLLKDNSLKDLFLQF